MFREPRQMQLVRNDDVRRTGTVFRDDQVRFPTARVSLSNASRQYRRRRVAVVLDTA